MTRNFMEEIRVFTTRNKPLRRLRPNPGTWIGRALRIAFSAAAIALAGTGCGNLTLETPPDKASTITATDNFMSGPTPARSEVPMNSNYHLVGYYASWDVYERAMFLTRIQTDRITQINYAFSNISPEGKCVLGDVDADIQRFYGIGNSIDGIPDTINGARGNFHQLALLKQKNPNLKMLISVGGWTWSEHFSDAALSEESRLEFVKSCLDLYLVRYGDAFDGVDIDWEFPVSGGLKTGRPEDKHNFTLLLEEFRRQMDVLQQTTGRKYLLTIAGPASPEAMGRIELNEIHKVLDWINLMAYDFHVAAEPATGFLSPLYGSPRDPDQNSKTFLNGDAAVRGYLAAGVPAKKIVLGIPFYGRAWTGATGDGLFAPAAGPAHGMYEPGYMDYAEIFQGPLQSFQRHWDDDAKVPWLFDPASGTFITYDDAESIQWKVKYIQENGLGGGMIWELGSDGGKLLAPLADSLFR
jgi:chitinase